MSVGRTPERHVRPASFDVAQPDADRSAVPETADLERRDDLVSPRKAVGLCDGRVLGGRGVGVAGDHTRDGLAVAREAIRCVRVHEIRAGAAAHRVPPAAVDLDPVVSGLSVDAVGARTAWEEVGALGSLDDAGSRRSGENG